MRDESDLNHLLSELREAGRKPDQALLDRAREYGQAAVRPLIEMAVDEDLHRAASKSPEVWAPLHAIRLLGELGASEAIEPLLPLFDWVDDDALAQALPDAFGGFGAPAVPPLRVLLFDRSRDVFARVRAVESLGKIGQRHAETRSEVVKILVACLDPAEAQTPKDEILVSFAISELLDLKAVEAISEIRRAFEEDRVDTSIVGLSDALKDLGLPPESRSERADQQRGMRLRLRCTACHYEREHYVGMVYCDLATMERRKKGEEATYSEFVIPQRITCPKCGAVDQYEFSSQAYIALMAELLKKQMAHELGRPGGDSEAGTLQLIRFGLTDGREMHPYAARELYRQKVEAHPDRADLRVRYANVLRILGYREETVEQYRAGLRLDASNLEAHLNLARLAGEAGDLEEARRRYESVLSQAPSSRLSRDDRQHYVDAAVEELAELVGPPGSPLFAQLAVQRAYMGAQDARGAARGALGEPSRATPKVGRNDPCPCGSGKKYKKCHGR